MGDSLILLKIQIINMLNLQEVLSKNNKKRSNYIIIIVGVMLMGLLLCIYSASISLSFMQMGLAEEILPYLISITSVAVLFLTWFKANGILFGNKDFEMIMSMPVKISSIILSRFMMLYSLNLILCLLFFIPSSIVWSIYGNGSLLDVTLIFISTFFVPLIPMIIACIVSIILFLILSKFRYKNLLLVGVSLILMICLGYFFMSNGSESNLLDMNKKVSNNVFILFPLAKLLSNALSNSDFINITIFVVLSSILFLAFIKGISPYYIKLNSKIVGSEKFYQYQWKALSKRSQFIALLYKEWSVFKNSYVYMLNTGLGVFILSLFSIVSLFLGIEDLLSRIGMSSITVSTLKVYLPLIIVAFLSISCTTSSSVSLEGKNIWISQVIPVDKRVILNAKIALNLLIHVPIILISSTIIGLQLKITTSEVVIMLIVPLIYSLFISTLGLFINLKFPNFSWTTETMVVKQSASSILSGLLNMISISISFGVVLLTPIAFKKIATVFCTIIILITTLLLYRSTLANKSVFR